MDRERSWSDGMSADATADPTTPTMGELAELIDQTRADIDAARAAQQSAAHRVRILQDQLARLVGEYDALAKAPLS